MITIAGNKLSLCHKGCGGIAVASIPDICKTPAPFGMVPVPYPNIAKAQDLQNGSKKVKADGNSIALQGSKLNPSTGDEPGTGGGIISNVTKGEAAFITFSPTIIVEGKPACRFMDKLTMNKQNTVCLSGIIIPPVVVAGSSAAGDELEELKEEELLGIVAQDNEGRLVTASRKLNIVGKTKSNQNVEINISELYRLLKSGSNLIKYFMDKIRQEFEAHSNAQKLAELNEAVDGDLNGKNYSERYIEGKEFAYHKAQKENEIRAKYPDLKKEDYDYVERLAEEREPQIEANFEGYNELRDELLQQRQIMRRLEKEAKQKQKKTDISLKISRKYLGKDNIKIKIESDDSGESTRKSIGFSKINEEPLLADASEKVFEIDRFSKFTVFNCKAQPDRYKLKVIRGQQATNIEVNNYPDDFWGLKIKLASPDMVSKRIEDFVNNGFAKHCGPIRPKIDVKFADFSAGLDWGWQEDENIWDVYSLQKFNLGLSPLIKLKAGLEASLVQLAALLVSIPPPVSKFITDGIVDIWLGLYLIFESSLMVAYIIKNYTCDRIGSKSSIEVTLKLIGGISGELGARLGPEKIIAIKATGKLNGKISGELTGRFNDQQVEFIFEASLLPVEAEIEVKLTIGRKSIFKFIEGFTKIQKRWILMDTVVLVNSKRITIS